MPKRQNSSLKLDFRSKPLASQLEPLCKQVLAEFQLPVLRLYCYFAETDDPYLREKCGDHYRGLHISIAAKDELPLYLQQLFFHPDDAFDYDEEITFEKMVAFDNLIYITHITSRTPIVCVTTFAHELQHFIQHGKSKKLMAANSMLYDHILRFDTTTPRTAIDIPNEREANIVSKRIAERICGIETVKAFAEEQVVQFAAWASQGDKVAAQEKIRWEFFRDVPSATEYDFAAETISLVDRFRPQLIAERFGINEGIDFHQTEWWL